MRGWDAASAGAELELALVQSHSQTPGQVLPTVPARLPATTHSSSWVSRSHLPQLRSLPGRNLPVTLTGGQEARAPLPRVS